jgi:dipeptidyl aminopeptidase/acylaminoacyl peptidase
MGKTGKRTSLQWSGTWLSVAAVVVVLGWRGIVWANRPAHFMDVARELGSIGQFKDDLFPNQSGKGIVYTEDIEHGEGLFFCNIPTGKTKLLCELKDTEFGGLRFGMLGWSPDDSKFAYARSSTRSKMNICICEAEAGELITKIEVPGNVSDLAWLTADSFAYLAANNQLKVIEHKPDGRWAETHNFNRLPKARGAIRNLVATSPSSVAWSNRTNLYALDFSSGTPQIIWQGTNSQLLGFTFSRASNEFLLNCLDAKDQFLLRFDPWRKWLVNAGRVGDAQHPIQDIAWTDGGASYCYRLNDGGTNTFFMKHDVDAPPTRLPWPGAVRTFASNGRHLYVAGSVGGDPAGIHDYDPKANSLQQATSSLKSPLHYAKCVTPINGAFTNEQGRIVNYALWRPVNVEPHTKYPLILSQTPYIWMPFPQIAANLDYNFVMIDRPSWANGLENWSADVMDAYQRLIKDPNVDTNRVFLYGASAETGFISQLLTEKPELWKGAITLSTSMLPNPATVHSHLSGMMAVVGKNEGEDVTTRWQKYQDEAAMKGVRVNLVFQDETQHISRSIATELVRAENFARFLDENR